jgi:hypothetical protein
MQVTPSQIEQDFWQKQLIVECYKCYALSGLLLYLSGFSWLWKQQFTPGLKNIFLVFAVLLMHSQSVQTTKTAQRERVDNDIQSE